MKVSAFELSTVYATALKMHGLPAGCANDAAAMAMSLDLWGMDGLGALGKFLDRDEAIRVPDQVTLRQSASTAVVDAGGQSLLLVAGSALDLVCAELKDTTVVVKNVTDAVFTAGLTGLCHSRALNAVLEWQFNEELLTLCTAEDPQMSRVQIADTQRETPASEFKLHIGTQALAAKQSNRDLKANNATTLRAIEAQSIRDGVEVDDRSWQRIVALANKILVPENAQSRAGGAGVGADED